MKMFFECNERVTISYGLDSWSVYKQYIADFLTEKLDDEKIPDKAKATNIENIEKTIVLAYLPLISEIELGIQHENTIMLKPFNFKMEISEQLYGFLMSR